MLHHGLPTHQNTMPRGSHVGGHAVATIKGCTKVGLNLLLFTVHPMKPGATLMSSFLFNVALILLSTNAAIQFCQQCFALYANETAIFQIWGGQVRLAESHEPIGGHCSRFIVPSH